MEKIKILYICGSGYSGSTILDLLLGSHSVIESIGEFHHYNKVLSSNSICTCNKKIRECAYWCEIRKIYSKLIAKYKMKNLKKEENDILKDYFMFKAILKFTDKKIIVDSSKKIDRFKLFLSSDLFNIKLIYLIRECQGFMYSSKKRQYTKVIRPILDKEGNIVDRILRKKRIYDGPLKTALLWFMENWEIINFLKRTNPENRIIVRYKDLELYSKRELMRICEMTGIKFEEDMLNYSNRIHHNIGGNPTRMRKNTSIIRYDDQWKMGLSRYEMSIANFFNQIIDRLLHNMGQYR